MSTTKTELEQLRLARQAAREAEEARVKEEAFKAAEMARKEAFKKKTAMFTQKPTPTVEEVVSKVKQEEQKRKFNRKLNRILKDDPSENPLAVEYSLKNGMDLPNHKALGASDESDWELIEQEGVPPYYWNKRTNESTYDNPFADPNRPVRPPPPPRQLVGINESKDIAWMRVIPEDGVTPPYFWNKYTDESKYDEPEEFVEYDGTLMPVQDGSEDGTLSRLNECENETASMAASRGDDNANEGDVQPHEMGTAWEETLNTESGEIVYVHTAVDGTVTTRLDRPEGSLYIVVPPFVDELNVSHERESWEEVFANEVDAEGNETNLVFYKNLTTAEIVGERPTGQVIIVEDTI